LKTLGASDEGIIVDFWTANVFDLTADIPLVQTYRLHWTRWDEREPDVRGEETLTLTLPAYSGGQQYMLPSQDIKAEYSMATPAKGQGARAVDLQGIVRVVLWDPLSPRVWLDLKARMARLDAPGVEFDEAVRGLFALKK
jgi:hypothetical protein